MEIEILDHGLWSCYTDYDLYLIFTLKTGRKILVAISGVMGTESKIHTSERWQ